MVQTNLPEPDMADIDAAAFAKSLKDFGATVVNLNAAGIIASYETQLDFQPRSAYLTGDNLRRIIEECHQQGLRVIARTDFSRCCFSKRMRKLFRKNEKSVLRFCNKSSKTKRAFTKVLMPCKRPF